MLKIRGFVTDGMSVKLTPFGVLAEAGDTKVTVAEKGVELVVTVNHVVHGQAKLRLRKGFDALVVEDIEGYAELTSDGKEIVGLLSGTGFQITELEGEYSLTFETAPKPDQYYGQTVEVRWTEEE